MLTTFRSNGASADHLRSAVLDAVWLRGALTVLWMFTPQVRRAIDWLGDKGEARRYAAALILRELAESAPAVFNVHVRAFIDAIWNGLRDPKQLVREASVAALRVRPSLHTLPRLSFAASEMKSFWNASLHHSLCRDII